MGKRKYRRVVRYFICACCDRRFALWMNDPDDEVGRAQLTANEWDAAVFGPVCDPCGVSNAPHSEAGDARLDALRDKLDPGWQQRMAQQEADRRTAKDLMERRRRGEPIDDALWTRGVLEALAALPKQREG